MFYFLLLRLNVHMKKINVQIGKESFFLIWDNEMKSPTIHIKLIFSNLKDKYFFIWDNESEVE